MYPGPMPTDMTEVAAASENDDVEITNGEHQKNCIFLLGSKIRVKT